MENKRIAFIFSKNVQHHCDRLPTLLNRASQIQDLINSYHILKDEKLLVVESLDATEEELKLFHSSDYIDFLKKMNDLEDFDDYEEDSCEFGLGYDCPILEKNYDFAKAIAGSSLTAAKLLIKNKCNIAINWYGGWHHAQRDSASGFCYVNDLVLAIQKLTETFSRVLYLDLDIHHGDGVQNAFEFSKKILTLSFHKLMPGFFPGTGSIDDVGSSKGRYYSINVPFLEGVNETSYLSAFTKIFPNVMDSFKPKAIVVQCGGDSLNGDEIGQSNLTLKTIGKCVQDVLNYNLPVIFCGGGGYNFSNTARLWTYLTAVIIKRELDNDIPDDSEFFTSYGPTYELHIDAGFQKDFNTESYINEVVLNILMYCKYIKQDQESLM